MIPKKPDTGSKPPDKRPEGPQGLGPPGKNPLFWGVLIGTLLGLIAAAAAGDAKPGAALESNIVFRVEVGAVVALTTYWIAAALWLAWHQTLFQRLGVKGAEPPAPADVDARDKEITEWQEWAAAAIEELDGRLQDLEEEDDSESDDDSSGATPEKEA